MKIDKPYCRKYILDRINIDPSGCWVWQKYLNTKGYGEGSVGNRHWRAHRLAYVAFRGDIPGGKFLDHLCRNRACVNPEHLRIASSRENTLAENSMCLAAINMRKTKCYRGHPLKGKNLNISKDGSRHCVKCRTIISRRTYLRKKLNYKLSEE